MLKHFKHKTTLVRILLANFQFLNYPNKIFPKPPRTDPIAKTLRVL